MVRVDIFKPTGKWLETIEVYWAHYDNMSIHDAFARSLRMCINGKYSGCTAVCLKPHHEHSHPVMLKNWDEYVPSPLKLQ